MHGSAATALALALLLPVPGVSHAQDVLLDTFDDEQAGAAPVAPDLGSYGIVSGSHTVIDGGGGNLRLRSLDDSAASGFVFGFQPTGSLERAQVSYLLRIESGATLVGANDFDQQIVMSPPGTNLSIEWGFGGFLGVRIFAGGGESQFFVPGFLWDFDTDYRVAIGIDGASDRYTLAIDDAVLVDEALGADLSSIDRISFRAAFASSGSQQIDDVRISVLPEPGGAAPAGGAIVALGAIARRRGRRAEGIRADPSGLSAGLLVSPASPG
jgi:hypothetical protein